MKKKSEDVSLSPFWAVGPSIGHLTSLSLNFLSSKMGIIHSFNKNLISSHYVLILLVSTNLTNFMEELHDL